MSQEVALPPGYRLAAFECIDSTNAEALRRAGADPGGLWVWSHRQTAGRGRAGRSWDSEPGNLYASLLLRPACSLDIAVQLAFVAGLATFDAVEGVLVPGGRERLRLKWPNDLLLDGRKLAGVLIESLAAGADGKPAVAMGIGINVTRHPQTALRPATDLAAAGATVAVPELLERLATAADRWIAAWAEGGGFAEVRREWEARALAIGHPLRVRLADREEHGFYGGIDAMGALKLVSSSGSERRICAGDVFTT